MIPFRSARPSLALFAAPQLEWTTRAGMMGGRESDPSEMTIMARLKMPRPIPVFDGEKVLLRPPDPTVDAKDYFEMNRDPAMHTWTGNRVFASEAEAKEELERFVAMDDISMWVIVDKPSGRVIGRFFLCVEDRDGIKVVGEGNRIAKPHWRRGHNREARLLLFPYIFNDLKADVIETGAWIGNTNSLKSIESYGFQFDREEEKWNEKYSQQMTMRYYTMTKQQWEATTRAEPGVGQEVVVPPSARRARSPRGTRQRP